MGFAGIAALSAAVIVLMWSFDGAAPQTQADIDGDARYKCRFAIRRTLNDPESVEWVNQTGWPVTRDGLLYNVDADYRAKNVFGATILTTSRCEIHIGDDGNPVVLSVTD